MGFQGPLVGIKRGNAPVAPVVHFNNGAEFPHLRIPRSSAVGTVFAGIKPATPAARSALLPPPPPARAAGLPFPRSSSSCARGPVPQVQALFFPDRQGLRRRRRGAGRHVPAGPLPGRGFRRAVAPRLNRAGGPWITHPGRRAIRSSGRKKETGSQIGGPGRCRRSNVAGRNRPPASAHAPATAMGTGWAFPHRRPVARRRRLSGGGILFRPGPPNLPGTMTPAPRYCNFAPGAGTRDSERP